MEKKAELTARMERVYTAGGKHIVTVWAESVDSTKQQGESYLGWRDRTEPMRLSIQQQTFDRARLFAAAPELLEALRLMVDDHFPDLPLGEQARRLTLADAAIAKATGE